MSDRGVAYRPPFILVFALIFLVGSATGAILRAVLVQSGYPVPGVASYTFLRLLCIVYLWAALCALALAEYLSIRITIDGIWGRTFWGRKRFLRWDEMRAVRRTGLWPFRFLRVFTGGPRPPLWLPLFTKRREELRDVVAARTNEGHPLRVSLQPPAS